MCYYHSMRVVEYLLEDGSSPFKRWFDSLDAQGAAKVSTANLRLERGLLSSIKWFEGIGEYKIDWGPGYRIYLAKDGGELIILFGGGTKKQQHADIQEAKRLYYEYKQRKAKAKAEEKSKAVNAKKSKG